jgi:phospholipase/carboxylesterase
LYQNAGKHEDLGFIHNFIPAREEGARVLLLLHGTGGNEDDLLTVGQMLDQKASILAPRGKVMESGMPRYFRRLAEGVFDIEDLKVRTNELADFVRRASLRYKFSLNSLVAVGYSNGANTGATLLLLHPGLVQNAILFRAMIPLVPEKQPDLRGTRVFLSGGRFDSMIPQDKTEELRVYLQNMGAEVKMNWEDSTHSLTSRDIEKAKIWLDRA